MWWIALHALVVGAILASGLAGIVAAAGVVGALVHAIVRVPSLDTPVLVLGADGRWAVPERGLDGLALAPGSRFTAYWARLRLSGPAGTLDVLLLIDQLDEPDWRRLQARLRRLAVSGNERPLA